MSNPILGAALIGIKIHFLVCLRADVSYFLCCTRKTKEIGNVCTKAIFDPFVYFCPLLETETETI